MQPVPGTTEQKMELERAKHHSGTIFSSFTAMGASLMLRSKENPNLPVFS